MDKALRILKKKCSRKGIELEVTTQYMPHSVDGLVVVALDRQDLKCMSRKPKKLYLKWSLELNLKKTQSLYLQE